MPTQDSDATVEIDERRLQELLTNTGLANWQQDAILIAIRTAWRESALAERQRAADDARDGARWNALVELWHASTELSLTQDEDGRWSITVIEPVEGMPSPGKWTGDYPDAALDAMSAQGDA